MQEYGDCFKPLHEIITNCPHLKSLPYRSVRELIFKIRKIKYNKNRTLITFKEYSLKVFFVLTGVVAAYIFNSQTREKVLFQTLQAGSSFNLKSSLWKHYSLLQFETHTKCIILEIEMRDIKNLAKVDLCLKEALGEIKAMIIIQGSKYDFYYHDQKKQIEKMGSFKIKSVKIKRPLLSKAVTVKASVHK